MACFAPIDIWCKVLPCVKVVVNVSTDVLIKIFLDGQFFLWNLGLLRVPLRVIRIPGVLLRLISLLAHPLVEFLYFSSSGLCQITVFGAF